MKHVLFPSSCQLKLHLAHCFLHSLCIVGGGWGGELNLTQGRAAWGGDKSRGACRGRPRQLGSGSTEYIHRQAQSSVLYQCYSFSSSSSLGIWKFNFLKSWFAIILPCRLRLILSIYQIQKVDFIARTTRSLKEAYSLWIPTHPT